MKNGEAVEDREENTDTKAEHHANAEGRTTATRAASTRSTAASRDGKSTALHDSSYKDGKKKLALYQLCCYMKGKVRLVSLSCSVLSCEVFQVQKLLVHLEIL